jgi:hypothetical protein
MPSKLADEAGSLSVWLSTAQVIDPTAESHVIPARFVVAEDVSSDDDLVDAYIGTVTTQLLVDDFWESLDVEGIGPN